MSQNVWSTKTIRYRSQKTIMSSLNHSRRPIQRYKYLAGITRRWCRQIKYSFIRFMYNNAVVSVWCITYASPMSLSTAGVSCGLLSARGTKNTNPSLVEWFQFVSLQRVGTVCLLNCAHRRCLQIYLIQKSRPIFSADSTSEDFVN